MIQMKEKLIRLTVKVKTTVSGLLANPKSRIIVFVGIFAIIGGTLLLISRAATPNVSIEAENGTINGCASTADDSTASSGKHVLFGSKDGSSPGYEVSKIPNPNQPSPSEVTTELKLYVSLCSGSDSNNGTDRSSPFKTIGAAIKKSNTAASSAIFIASGIYREALGDITKPVIIQPLPGHNVWLSGSDPVPTSAWVQNGDKWATTLDLRNSDLCTGCSPAPSPDENPVTLGDNPAMVFIGGEPLTQKATAADVLDNTFSVSQVLLDGANATNPLYRYTFTIGPNPDGKPVEITKRIF